MWAARFGHTALRDGASVGGLGHDEDTGVDLEDTQKQRIESRFGGHEDRRVESVGLEEPTPLRGLGRKSPTLTFT